ncbi:MAG: hypothetical protein K2F81_08425 [Ruminococcus sp.]|nr:hypothetical protein [Ruminococcus sp.]
MASINMKSILAKAQSHMESKVGQSKVDNVISKVMLGNIRLQSRGTAHTPEEAASKFIEVLRNSINSAGLSEGAIGAVSNIEHGSAHSIGHNTYIIGVYFVGDMARPSLDEAKYGGINDIVALFNNGVDHTMRPVHGLWHGKETWSRTVIPGTHFIEQAVSDFMGNYASEYNVTSISVEGI